MVVELILSAGGITTILIFVITPLVTHRCRYHSKLPSGPVPFPLIGNLMTMKSGKLRDVYRHLRAKYGDLFTLHLGSKIVIVFNGYETLKKAFVKRGDVFSNRPAIFDFGDLKGDEENLNVTLLSLFGGGTETTSTTIRWAVLYLIHYSEIQEKVRKEIENVVGPSRQPTMEDKPNLPYVEAFFTEVQRHANIAPNSVPHAVSDDVMFNGHLIPKEATLILNLDSVLADPDFFPDPLKFNPSRFIGADGKFTENDKVIAFSIGRRQCLGESLARMELFLFLTSMVQHFQFYPENADELPSMEGIIGITYPPQPYRIKAVKIN